MLVPRTIPIQKSEEKATEFKSKFRLLYGEEDVWFYDESGFACDMKPRRQWAKKGSKPTHYYLGNHFVATLLEQYVLQMESLKHLLCLIQILVFFKCF